jgi:hypothetical protein
MSTPATVPVAPTSTAPVPTVPAIVASPGLVVEASRVDFGTDVAVQTVVLRNAGATAVHWRADAAAPFSIFSVEGRLEAGAEQPITVALDRFALPAGLYEASLTVDGSDGSARSVELAATQTQAPALGAPTVRTLTPKLGDDGACHSMVVEVELAVAAHGVPVVSAMVGFDGQPMSPVAVERTADGHVVARFEAPKHAVVTLRIDVVDQFGRRASRADDTTFSC